MKLSDDQLQRLRDLPIEEVAQRLGLDVSRHHCLCPFHPDKHPSLVFNPRRNTCRCYVCMDSGSMGTIDLVMRYTNKTFREAVEWLADGSLTTSLPRREGGDSYQKKGTAFDPVRYARFFERPWLSAEASRFLFEQRRLDPRVVYWCRLSSWRDKQGVNWLQTPYYDAMGRLIGLQNRNLGPSQPASEGGGLCGQPRFRFPYGSRCSIYNLPVLQLLRPGEALYIAEGCSDCWSLLSAGHKAIAIPSATLLSATDKQLLQSLAEERQTVFHMYPDKDEPGERLFVQLCQILPKLVRHTLPEGCKDFSDYYLRCNGKEMSQ